MPAKRGRLMRRALSPRNLLVVTLLAAGLVTQSAQAGRFEILVERIKGGGQPAHNARCEACDRCPESDEQRAGNPRGIAPWATCFPNRKYCGYYVGGAATLYADEADCLHGERRRFHEGTFGLDYRPGFSRVRLQWFHRPTR